MAACDGADRLQAEQCSLTARMSLVIPGQNTIDLACDSMCGMEDSKDLVTERRGYDNTVTVQDDPVCYVERVTIIMSRMRRYHHSRHDDHLGSPFE